MKNFLTILLSIIFSTIAVSCIEDGVSTSPSEQPEFSVDTLDLGEVFKGSVTPTSKFMVYNRHSKIINISTISLRGDAGEVFRLNVDGTSGRTFSNIEIRPNDSIYVMVEAILPRDDAGPKFTTGVVDFVTSGVSRSVVLAATGLDVDVIKGLTIEEDTRWTAGVPRQIFDSLVVAEGATLTIEGGSELLFHDKARMIVRGRLVSEGTPERPVTMGGDRRDNVVGEIPFDLMAAQWDGVTFAPTSSGSRLSHTVIKNMTTGVSADSVSTTADGKPGLTLVNCRIRNSAGYSFLSYFSDIEVVGTEFSDAALTPLMVVGGKVDMTHVTVSNYYLFAAIAYPLVNLGHYNAESAIEGVTLPYMSARFTNCIFYGLGYDFNVSDLTGTDVIIQRTLFKSAGEDDANFVECLWDIDPLFYTVREDFIFDYRVKDDSPARGAGLVTNAPADFYGTPRDASAPTLGAYEWTVVEDYDDPAQ